VENGGVFLYFVALSALSYAGFFGSKPDSPSPPSRPAARWTSLILGKLATLGAQLLFGAGFFFLPMWVPIVGAGIALLVGALVDRALPPRLRLWSTLLASILGIVLAVTMW
jgi:hypothetical protein